MRKDLTHEEKNRLAKVFAGIITFIILLVWLQFSFASKLGSMMNSFGKISEKVGEVISRAKTEFKLPDKEEVRMCSKQQKSETKKVYEKERE